MMHLKKVQFAALAGIAAVLMNGGCGGSGGPPSSNAINTVISLPEEGRSYIAESQQPIYQTTPPASGPQVPKAPAPGFYTNPQKSTALVNALFHSNIVIYYDPTTVTTAETTALKALATANALPYKGVVIVPFAGLPTPFTVSAWQHLLRLSHYDTGAIANFISLYIGKGPMTAAGTEPAPIENFPDEGHTHVAIGTTITYATNPPNSGPHYPIPEPVGFYDTTQESGYLVHAMEHSNVIIYYDPTTVKPDTLTALKALAAKNTGSFGGIIVTPRTDATYEVIAVAWQNWVRQNSFDAKQIQQFMDLYMGHGPEQIPHSD